MSLAKRALAGTALTLITVALLGAAGWRIYEATSSAEKRKRPPVRERSYTVDVSLLNPTSASPKVTAFGQVQTWNSLEIRAPASGAITEISPNFKDGLSVKQGELLFRIDPDSAERRVIDAKAALSQAKFELSEAKLSLLNADADLSATAAQTAIRKGDLERKQSLAEKRLTTSTIVNDARLALAASEQASLAKQQAVLVAKSRIDKSSASVSRAELTLRDAEKALSETSYRAPFDGLLTDVSATLGRRMAQNEKFGLLIDPKAMEVAFPVRASEFGHLVDPAAPHKLAPLKVQVALDHAGATIMVDGILDRTAAVAASQFGRTIFAKLNSTQATAIRPGDFVTVSVFEPPIPNVAVVPTAAATDDGRILLVGSNARLIEHQARVVRRQGETLIVSDVPFGQRYVRLRLPFLASGVKVKARETDAVEAAEVTASEKSNSRRDPIRTSTSPAESSSQTTEKPLDDAKRAAFIALVKSSTRMTEERRQQVLKELEKPVPSERIVRRLERQLARRGERS